MMGNWCESKVRGNAIFAPLREEFRRGKSEE